MDFDRNKNGNINLFEDKGETKEDKIDRLKKYEEYWNFEKNYHYNSKIDSTIADINKNYASVKKSEQIKMMKDVINQICGTAAKYLGLSWDIIGDDKYLFGFYETNGSKNHMQILIPYDFKFSALKQKLLDWFLKKKEPVQKGMDDAIETKPKKPSIKMVESFTKKISGKNENEFTDSDKELRENVDKMLFDEVKDIILKNNPKGVVEPCYNGPGFSKHCHEQYFYHDDNFHVKGLPKFRIRKLEYYFYTESDIEGITVYFYDGGTPLKWQEMDFETKKRLKTRLKSFLSKKNRFYMKESFTKKTAGKKTSDLINDIIIPYDVAFQKSLSIIKDNIGVPSIKDGQTLFFGPLGKYDASEELDSNKLFIKFSTDKRVKMDTTAQNNMIDYGCTFYLVFHDDDTFNFYFFIGHNFYPQGRIFYINDQTNTLVRQRGETSNLSKIIYKTKENCMKISAKNFNVIKLFIERFCKTAYNKVLEKGLTEPYRYHQINERLIPVFEDYIFDLYTDVLKTLNVESPLLNESFIGKTARKKQKDLSSQADDSIMTVPFQSELIKEMCIHIWGSEESKKRGEVLIKDIKNVEEFMTKENWDKVPRELRDKLSSFSGVSEPFNEFRYFTGIKKIKHSTFENISYTLSEITLPESVKEIERFGFSFHHIRKITLNEGLEKIGEGAFTSTEYLESIVIPSTVKSIGDSAFKKSGISFIKLNEGLEEIGAKAFTETPNLKTVTIPSTVREIGGSVFKYSAIGTNVKIAEGNEHIINIDNILYSSDGTKMIDILGSRRDISDFKIKDGVKVIGDNLFQGTKITEINIPDSVEEIGNGAFYGVPLKKIHFGKNLKKIGNECFRECSQIIEMNIPESIESFGDRCFMHLSRWGSEESDSRTLDLSKCSNIRYIGNDSFNSVGFEEIILPENPKFLTLNNTFCFSENLKKVIIPEGVKEMKQTFCGCKNLEETNLPSTLEYVLNPFQFNYKLKEFVFDEIPKSWKYYSGLYNIHIKNFVVNADEEGNPKYFVDFSENDEIFKTPMKEATIDNIKFNEGVKVIPSNSFGSLNDSKVLFPSSLEIIEKNAFQRFRNCEIFFKPSKKIPNIHKDAFGWSMDGCTIYCDEKKYRSFHNAEKYRKIFRTAEIRLLGDYNSNTFEEGYYEQGTYDSNQFGSHNYAFKILKREFKTITSNDDEIREYWRRYQYRQRMNIKDDEKCPEPVYEVKFNGYIEVPTNQLPDNISNLDIKNKLNEIKIGDEKSLKELLVNIINPSGEEMYKPKVKVIYKDSNEIVFNLSRLFFFNVYRNKVSTKHRIKTIEILFILSYDGKFSESFNDTEIQRLEKYELKMLEIEEKEHKAYERNFQREVKRREREEEKLREKRRKQREREDRRRERELEKIRLKEENRRQREMRKQMKNASSEENQDTNEHRRFDFDSARFLKS